MLEHDYIVEIVRNFIDTVSFTLRGAYLRHSVSEAKQTEEAIAELMEMDVRSALFLSPASLVTMMQLSGIGDATAGYVCYALNKLGDSYCRMKILNLQRFVTIKRVPLVLLLTGVLRMFRRGLNFSTATLNP